MKVVKSNGQKMYSHNQKFSPIKRDYNKIKKKVDSYTVILNKTIPAKLFHVNLQAGGDKCAKEIRDQFTPACS